MSCSHTLAHTQKRKEIDCLSGNTEKIHYKMKIRSNNKQSYLYFQYTSNKCPMFFFFTLHSIISKVIGKFIRKIKETNKLCWMFEWNSKWAKISWISKWRKEGKIYYNIYFLLIQNTKHSGKKGNFLIDEKWLEKSFLCFPYKTQTHALT